MKKTLFTSLKVAASLAIGAFFIWFFLKDLEAAQKKEIMETFGRANYGWLLLSLLIAVISHVLRTLRWQMLLNPIGCKARFSTTFLGLMIGYFANLALPRLGEITRCGILQKYDKVPFEKSFGTVVAERALDILTFFLLFFINLALQYDQLKVYASERIFTPMAGKFSALGHGYIPWALSAFAAILLILFLLFRKRIGKNRIFTAVLRVFRGFWTGLKSLAYVKNPVLFVAYTLLIWTMYYFMTWVCFFCLTETAHFGFEPAFSVLVMGTIGMMVVQGGIGIYPVLVAETLSLPAYGGNPAKTFALGWLIWGTQTITIIAAGLFSLIFLPVYNTRKDGKNRDHSQ